MAAHYNIYCPHCSHRLSRGKTSLKTYGCPIQKCPECGKTYCDPYCFEQALRPYKPQSLFKLLFASFILASGAGVLFGGLTDTTAASDRLVWSITAVSFVAAWLVIFICLMKSRDRVEKKRLNDWQESDKRLRDGGYAALLKAAGFKVPSHYLPEDYQPTFPSIPPNVVRKKYYLFLTIHSH